MQSCNFIFFISALACEIAKGKTADEINLLSALFSQLGDTLDTIAAQEALCSSNAATTTNCDSSDVE